MTRDEAVSLIQTQLGFRTTGADQIITQLQLAQTILESGPTLPFFLVSEDAYAITTDAEQRLLVPSDFLRETDEAVLRYVPDTISSSNPEVDLDKGDYDDLRKLYQDTTTGTTKVGHPEAYCILGNYFRIFPIPDDEYTLHMIYYQQDDLLTSNIENGWLLHAPLLMMGKAGKIIAGALRDTTAWGIFDAWEKEGARLLETKDVDRSYSNHNLQVGGPN
jgi:hypothetical protein